MSASGGRPTIFIAHPSDLLTDHVPNGDGLVAYGFLNELAARGYRLHIAMRAAEMHQPLPANAVLHPIPRRFRNAALDRLDYMRAIRRLLIELRRQEKIDLVHQMNPVFVGLSLGLVGCGLPVVLGTFVARWPGGEITDVGQGKLSRMVNGSLRWMINLVQQSHADALLVTTPAAMNRIAAPGLVRRKIALVRHGIDETVFSPDPQPADREGPPSILFYSHLDRRKGIFVLLDAFKIVAAEIAACRLVLVGRGEHEAEVREWIATSGCADRIDHHGPIPRAKACALMRSHNVYCLPSFGEPYATTVLEAMACGCPLVVTAAGGLRYMVPDVGGFHVPPGDADALAAALIKLLRSPELQRSMGAANRAHVERHHTWRAVVDDLEGVYARVIAGQPASQASPV